MMNFIKKTTNSLVKLHKEFELALQLTYGHEYLSKDGFYSSSKKK